ncbi:hypothetical protein [Rhodoblastus sp.]|jgi:hypothetical protein|uniref:hypothetical protein n=1 Tax=Rhodoblastus sp. TaxID=1962975 RepID=UPI0025E6F086|nr:hypothetical protein [Rhodoblastus sp.]
MARMKATNKAIEIDIGRLGESLEKLKTAPLTHVILSAIPDSVLEQFRPVLEAGLSDPQIIAVLSQDQVAASADLALLVPRVRVICDAVKATSAKKTVPKGTRQGQSKSSRGYETGQL